MKFAHKIAIVIISLVFGLFMLVGCAGNSATTNTSKVTFDTPEGAAPVQPVGHQGRYDDLGYNGCYGCHGSSSEADPFLTKAVSMPDNHYKNSNRSTYELDGAHLLCNSCHVEARKE